MNFLKINFVTHKTIFVFKVFIKHFIQIVNLWHFLFKRLSLFEALFCGFSLTYHLNSAMKFNENINKEIYLENFLFFFGKLICSYIEEISDILNS